MNPHKMNKVDISSMSEQDQKAFKMYGKMPAKNLLTKMQKDRKYFDSGDYMMSKAGVPTGQVLGTAIPTAEDVPHVQPPTPGLSSSPTAQSPAGMHAHSASPPMAHQGLGVGVGVGASPAATSQAMEVPGGAHERRGSESHPRISPPGMSGSQPSSFPIQHTHPHPQGFGSSPVKTSTLARRVDEEM